MQVSLDYATKTVRGKDRLAFLPDENHGLVLYFGDGVTIESMSIDGLPDAVDLKPEPAGVKGLQKISIKLRPNSISEHFAIIEFSATFKGADAVSESERHGVSYSSDAVIEGERAFLPSSAFWFPRGEGLEFFDVEVTLPVGMDAVTEGGRLERREVDGAAVVRYKTSHPIDGLNLVAGRFFVNAEKHKGVDVHTFFFDDDPTLSKIYLDSVRGYIDLYERIFPPYPYEKFAVVENFLPTGYGMPSFTLMGSEVLRLPFIPATSLGHEFAHNWWGNSVYVDPLYGNWAEALTTYTADHLYLEMAGEESGRDYRRRSLAEFTNYWRRDKGEDFALRDFKYESSTSARVVGYNKGAFVFHMLRRTLGDEAFYAGLREFYVSHAFGFATWADVQKTFERVSGRNLERFFGQWLTWSGGPVFAPENFFSDLRLDRTAEGYRVSFTVRQPGREYLIDLPIYFRTDLGEARFVETIVKDEQHVSLTLTDRPVYMEIDPDHDVFRVLGSDEIPPALSSFLGRDDGLVVPATADGKYDALAAALGREYGLRVVGTGELTRSAMRNKPLLILGFPEDAELRRLIDDNLPAEVLTSDGNAYFIKGEEWSFGDTVLALAMKDKARPTRPLALVAGSVGAEGMARLARRLPHLASKGYVVFRQDGTARHGALSGMKVLRYEFVR
jgi:aminopeptidase N